MIREVITYPNKLLRLKSKDVEQFDNKLHTLLDDMYETMMAQSGVGLAAIQVAIPLNVLIINLPNEDDIQDKNDLIEAINPVITHKDGTQIFTEGCLSVPGVYAKIKRIKQIELRAINIMTGKKIIFDAMGFPARVIQHECDHLNGVLFTDYIDNWDDLDIHNPSQIPLQLKGRFNK